MAVDSGAPLRLVKFTAEWCGPCHRLQPILDNLEPDFEGLIDFQVEDIDEHPELAAIYSILSVPTLLVLDDQGSIIRNLTPHAFNKALLRSALVGVLEREGPR